MENVGARKIKSKIVYINSKLEIDMCSCCKEKMKKWRSGGESCLDHWAEVINISAKTNKAKIVNSSDVYDWKKGLSHYFEAYTGISKFQHFVVDSSDPGWIWARYGVDDDIWKKRKLLISDSNLYLEEFRCLPKFLSTVGFKGGKFEKEKELFENLRQYVKDEWRDELCPDPETFIPPVRDRHLCPDWA
ncbi:MAG: hypothetical protein WCR46_19715 [Deltaproteobacteria bacterium]|jgi:hypothetical protein